MLRLKNAAVVAFTATGASLLLNLQPQVAAGVVAASFATTFVFPTLYNTTVTVGTKTLHWMNNQRPKIKEGAKYALNTARNIAWNSSPTNPNQNTLMGAGLGLAASTTIGRTTGLDKHPHYPEAVAAATAGGAFLGYLLPTDRIGRGLSKFGKAISTPTPPATQLPTPPIGQSSSKQPPTITVTSAISATPATTPTPIPTTITPTTTPPATPVSQEPPIEPKDPKDIKESRKKKWSFK